MDQIWFKQNKAGQKWSEKDVVRIFEETLANVEEDKTLMLKTDLNIYMLKVHGVSERTRRHWVSDLYKDNRSIAELYELISLIIESRVVKDKERELRPNIQALVLQNKHNYKERSESENKIVVKMPSVEIDGKEVKFDID